MNEQILKEILSEIKSMKADMEGLKLATDTKESIDRIEAKIKRITEIQVIQGEAINIIAKRQTNTEAEVNILRKAVR